LPATISNGRTGEVMSSSKVRERFSSARSRMERKGAEMTMKTPTEAKSRDTTTSVRLSRSSTPGASGEIRVTKVR
jgi:uncharacterized protein YjbK